MQEKFLEMKGSTAEKVIQNDLERRSIKTALMYCSKHSLSSGIYSGKSGKVQEKEEFDIEEVLKNESVDFGESKVNEDISSEVGKRTLFAALYGQQLKYEDGSDEEGGEDE